MDLGKKKVGAYIANIILIVNAAIHFSLSSYIFQYANYIGSQQYHTKIPLCSYIIVAGVLIILSAIISFANFFRSIFRSLAVASWFFGWITMVFNFAAGVIIAMRLSFYHQILLIANQSLAEQPKQFRSMYHLLMADTIFTFLLGFPSSIALSTLENHLLALAKVRNSQIVITTERRESQMQKKPPVVQ